MKLTPRSFEPPDRAIDARPRPQPAWFCLLALLLALPAAAQDAGEQGEPADPPAALVEDAAQLRAEEVFFEGNGLLSAGDPAGALTKYDESLALAPGFRRVHLYRARAFVALNDFEAAEGALAAFEEGASEEELGEATELRATIGEARDAAARLLHQERPKQAPILQIAVGGGYQRVGSWNYGSVAADLSLHLVGPLRLGLQVRPSFGQAQQGADGRRHQPVLVPFGAGVHLRFDGPVHLRVGAAAQLALDLNTADGTPRLLGGVVGLAGVEIPLPRTPLAIRPGVELGFLAPTPWFLARGLVELVIEVPRDRPAVAN